MPDSAIRRPVPLHVVIVTLDNHLSGAAERAAARFAADDSGITIGFHAAADWDRGTGSLDRCIADIGRADIVIATMLFLDDHIRAVLPALTARREACAAMVGLMSGSEIVRLTKLGDYRMDKPASGPLALLKRLRGSAKPGASSGAGQMRMLRRLPKILRFIPGTAQDVRAYFLTLQYWLAGSDDNVVGMIQALAGRYAGHAVRAAAPHDYPEVGVYHPAIPGRIADRADALPGVGGSRGTVGVLMLRSYLLGRDTGHYDGAIAAFEARGLRVIPAFASGLDSRPAIERFFMRDGVPIVARHSRDRQAADRAAGGEAMPGQVDRDDVVVLAEQRCERPPAMRRRPGAVEQQDRRGLVTGFGCVGHERLDMPAQTAGHDEAAGGAIGPVASLDAPARRAHAGCTARTAACIRTASARGSGR